MIQSRIETCSFSAPTGIDRTLLQWVVRVAGRNAVIETASSDNKNDTHIYASITVQNSFCGSGSSISQFAQGLVGCVRLLATPELSLADQSPAWAVVESWLRSTEATLLPLIRRSSSSSSSGKQPEGRFQKPVLQFDQGRVY